MNATLLERIESPETSVRLNVASGYRQFFRAISALPDVVELREQIRSRTDVLDLLIRIVRFVQLPQAKGCENPHDVAVAIYLWTLSQTMPAAAYAAAEIVGKCADCWWSRKLAEQLLDIAPKQHAVTTIIGPESPIKTKSKSSGQIQIACVGNGPPVYVNIGPFFSGLLMGFSGSEGRALSRYEMFGTFGENPIGGKLVQWNEGAVNCICEPMLIGCEP